MLLFKLFVFLLYDLMLNMLIKNLLPKPALAEFVRKYQIISWQFEASAIAPPKMLAPRPEHSLAFYIKDPQLLGTYTQMKK